MSCDKLIEGDAMQTTKIHIVQYGDDAAGHYCPVDSCGSANVEHVNVSCPDGRSGCLVLHWGYRCRRCGRVWGNE